MKKDFNRFDDVAKNWDNDPEKVERANIFTSEIINFIKPDKSMTAMEFGCGTGLLSVALRDHFKSITLIDNSQGMINVLEEKIEENGLHNFKPLCVDPLEEEVGLHNFDVAYILMTLHHIHDLNKIMQLFYSSLHTGGYLCIADLVTEDGTFHSNHPDFDGYNGFDKEELGLVLKKNGFETVFYKIVFEIEKEDKGILKKYPLFLMIAKKS